MSEPKMFAGKVESMKYYDHWLPDSDINELYMEYLQLQHRPWYTRFISWLHKIFHRRTLQETILKLKPVAYWPFDEVSGEIAKDISSNYNDAYYLEEAMSEEGSRSGFAAVIRKHTDNKE